MKMAYQSLRAFASTHESRRWKVSASVSLPSPATARCSFKIEGPIEKLVIPPKKDSPQFSDRLWQTTCFELFAARKDSPEYFEWNLSPSGDWALYCFSGYREKIPTPELAKTSPEVVQKIWNPQVFEMVFDLSLVPLLSHVDVKAGEFLELSPTTILNHGDQQTYWALQHSRTKPDFHRRENFVLTIPLFSGHN